MKQDPRDKRFYRLKKKDIYQLTSQEARVLISYCDKMIEFVSDKKVRKGWIAYKGELEAIDNKN